MTRPNFPSRTILGVALLITILGGTILAQNDPAADADSLFQKGWSEYRFRRLQPAREAFEELLRKFPEHPISRRGRIELAKVYVDLRDPDKAISVLQPLAEEKNTQFYERTLAREQLVNLLFELQRFGVGVETLEKWWKESPNDIDTGKNLARFYLQSGKADEARMLLEGLLERTGRKDIFNELLTLAIRADQVEGLLNSIEQRRVRYRNSLYQDLVSDCYLALKKPDKAAKAIRESPGIDNDVTLLKKLSRIELESGEVGNAVLTLRKLKRLSPGEWEISKGLGHCYYLQEKKAEALKEWRDFFTARGFMDPDAYQLLTEVLIEHKMFQEALDTFAEARKFMGNPTQFAEERAGVLDALGKGDEALEEYFQVLCNNVFKTEIFEKLYSKSSKTFDFKGKLMGLYKSSPSRAIKRALLEIFIREEDESGIPPVVWMLETDQFFEDSLFERVRQAGLSNPTPFLHRLEIALIQARRQSTLAQNLALLLLETAGEEPGEAAESLAEASSTAAVEPCPDLHLRNRLFSEMGRFCLERLGDVASATDFLERAAASPDSPEPFFESVLLLMRIRASFDDFQGAARELSRAQEFVKNYQPGGTVSPPPLPEKFLPGQNPGMDDVLFDDSIPGMPSPSFAPEELRSRLLFEEAWLMAQKGEYQESLLKLKVITDELPGSIWMNDGLGLALLITMGSTGNMDALGSYLRAERLNTIGSITASLAEMNRTIGLASGTPLEKDAIARSILISERLSKGLGSDSEDLIGSASRFVDDQPAHWAVPDLLLLKARLMKRTGSTIDQQADALKEFADRFPGDLRSRRAKLMISELMKRKNR